MGIRKKQQESGEKTRKEVGQAEACPTYTLRADRRFDLLAMVTIVSLAAAGREVGATPAEKLAELKAKLREFELYEEKHLR